MNELITDKRRLFFHIQQKRSIPGDRVLLHAGEGARVRRGLDCHHITVRSPGQAHRSDALWKRNLRR